MLFGMFIMFLMLTGSEGILAWLVWRRMAEHLKGNPEAVTALTTHLFVPLLGRKEAPPSGHKSEAKPEPKKLKGTLM